MFSANTSSEAVRNSTPSPLPGAVHQQQSVAVSLTLSSAVPGGQQRQNNVKSEPVSPYNRTTDAAALQPQQLLRPSSASPLSLVHHNQLSPNHLMPAAALVPSLPVSPDDSPSAKRARLTDPAAATRIAGKTAWIHQQN